MQDKSAPQNRLTRRTVLAILGTALATVTGGVYLRQRQPSQTDQRAIPAEPEIDTSQPIEDDEPDVEISTEVENIVDFGAVSNPTDPNLGAAERNLQAIRQAAQSAGYQGTIYIPSGTFFFGKDGGDQREYIMFGSDQPAGISVVGDGPTSSTLAITSHATAAEQPDQSGLQWADDVDHGYFSVRGLTLNGNYENIENLGEVGGGSRGIESDGDGELHVENVRFRGWHLGGIRGRGIIRSVKYSTFEDNGIGIHNDNVGGSVAHHISCRPPSDTELVVDHCLFLDCSGSAINIRHDDGNVIVRNCCAEGTGANFMKLSAGEKVELRNIYHKAHTESLVEKLVERADGANFYGNNFIQSLGDRGEEPVTVLMDNVKSEDIRMYAFQSRDSLGRGPAEIEWIGDMISFENTNMEYDNEVIRNRSGGKFQNVDINRMSVHNSGAKVFDTDKSNGRIQKLSHYGNEGGLGNPGNISIGMEIRTEMQYSPSVPEASEVGIEAFSVGT